MTACTIQPCPQHLTYYRPDEVAECFNVNAATYGELWTLMSEIPPMAERIAIEESCPCDDIDETISLPAFWLKLSPAARLDIITSATPDM